MKKISILLGLLLLTALHADSEKNIKLPNIMFPMVTNESFKVMQRNCQWCHSFGYVLNQGKQSRKFWHKTVLKMKEVYKAPISKKDENIAVDYLFKYYGNGRLE